MSDFEDAGNAIDVSPRIVVIREQRVLLDSDLAVLYGVKTPRLNEQVRRNLDRFPDDFVFRLTNQEFASLRSQNAILKTGRGQPRHSRSRSTAQSWQPLS